MSLPHLIAGGALVLVRLVLAAYPAAFRHQFAREAMRDLRMELESAADAGVLAAARASALALASAVRDLLAEHLSSLAGAAHQSATRKERRMIHGLGSDVRLAARRLRSQRLLTVAVVVTLGLAVGASTAIFSVADAVLFEPLPFPDGDRLVRLDERTVKDTRPGASLPAIDIWSREAPSLESIAFFDERRALVVVNGEPDQLAGADVSRAFFDVLRVAPALGPGFSAGPAFGGPAEIVISHRLWQQLGGRPDVLGGSLPVDPGEFRIVGIMPRGFDYPAGANFWSIAPASYAEISRMRQLRFVDAIGRLRAGTSVDALRQELAVLTARHPASDRVGGEVRMTATGLRDSLIGHVRPGLRAAAWAVAFLLVIACCNVTALLLAAAVTRHREMAVQSALGASSGRLLRQSAVEILLLALPACAFGVAIAWSGRDAIVAISFDEIPRIGGMAVDLRTLGFAMGTTLFCAALATVLPGRLVGRVDATAGLRAGTRDGGSSRHVLRTLRLLIVAEVALTFVITVGGMLLGRSMQQLSGVDTGFADHAVIAMKINLPLQPRLPRDSERAFHDELLHRVRALPDVESASYVGRLPLARAIASTEASASGEPSTEVRAIHNTAGPGYFTTIGAQIIDGRDLTDDDHIGGAAVVINEVLARQLFPARSAVGRRITFLEMRGPLEARVVGVVRPLRYNGLTGDLLPELHVDYRARPLPQWLVVRARASSDAMIPVVKATLRQADPTNRVTADPVTTFDREVARELARPRFFLALAGAFALVALALATLGLYGVMAFSVSQRRHDIGVRLALGATPSRLFASVMGSGAMLTATGLVVGAAGAVSAAHLMRSLLFGVEPLDPVTFAAATSLVIAVALLACWVPARRARATDPLAVLRSE